MSNTWQKVPSIVSPIRTQVIKIDLNLLAKKTKLQITKCIARAEEKRQRISHYLLGHSFVVWGLVSRVPIHDLKERPGHLTLIVTTIYVQATQHHISDSYLRSGFESKLVPRKAPRRTGNVY